MPDSCAANLALTDHAPVSPIAEIHALSESGHFGQALALVSSELSQQPHDSELLFARASVLFDWGRVREAYTGFLQAEESGLSRTALYLNLAWSCQLLGLPETAEPYARKAIALDPENAAAHFGLGTILQRLKRYPEAIASFEIATKIEPGHVQGFAGIGRCKLEQNEHAGAEDWLRRAIALAPENPQFWTNLGVALVNQERYGEALEALEHAATLESAQGALPLSMVDTAFTLVSIGRYREAFDLFRKRLPEVPDPRAHGYYAFLLLTLGHLREGWRQYEFRWMQEPHLSKRPDFQKPRWAGQDLSGKTILLLTEQGVGDIINFARYALPLKAMGATVLMQVRPEIMELAQGFVGVDRAFAPPTPPPPFDYHLPLMSVPRVLGTETGTIPADVQYVRVDPSRARHWADRVGGSYLKVGLVWAGNPKYPRDKYRSIAFDKLIDLWDVEGVTYFSLQTPLKDGDLAKFPTTKTLVNLGPELTDFMETAAVIAQLDLVICVDTAVAHLAGALGRPVWLLLPAIGDFRWFEARDDSPWYPTMRLFRQRVLGDWEEVIARVKVALQDAARSGVLPTPTATPLSTLVSSVNNTLLERTLLPEPANIACVTETRYGIVQYLPEMGRTAHSIAWYGEFLQCHLELLSKLIRPGAHVVDVGSGFGEHVIALAKMVGVQGHVLAYETRTVVQRVLRQNLEANRVAGIVTLMRRDLTGPQCGDLETTDVSADGHDATRRSDKAALTDTLDSLLLGRLDLLKVGASANAVDVLDGANETLWRLRPIVFISASDTTSVETLTEKLVAFGYRCWSMEAPYFDANNFNRRDVDIFDGDSSLALLAIPEEFGATIVLDGCVEVTAGHDRLPLTSTTTSDTKQKPNANSQIVKGSGELGLRRFMRKLLR